MDHEEPGSQEVLDEYSRLVRSPGDAKTFLDADTTLLIECRDEVENGIKSSVYSQEQLDLIASVDKEFKQKVKVSYEHYKYLIAQGADNSDYLQMVLRSLEYKHITNKTKWWFHLLED